MTLQRKIAFVVGYSTYAILLYSIVVGQPDLVMQFVIYAPAPLFALFILLFTRGVTINRGVVFFVFCCGLYYAGIYCIISQIADRSHYQVLIPLMSCLGAVFVSLAYSLVFELTLNFKKDVLKSGIIGLQVSVLTLITSFFFWHFSNELITQVIALGFYSIFPFWIVSMSKHLLSKSSA